MKITKQFKKNLLIGLMGLVGMNAIPTFAVYYTQQEYETILSGIINEDKGIVLENYPELGYLVYKNLSNETITVPYYTNQLVVEKEGIEEIEDRVGYIDELFPYFQFDPRDTTIDNIKPGDNIYLRTDNEGYITYISAYNDYMLRYGKVNTWTIDNGSYGTLVLEDEKGQTYVYQIPLDTPTTKSDRPYSISQLKPGEWVKVLISQRILGAGMVEDIIQEVVIDGDTRVISDVYKGQIMNFGSFDNTVRLAHAQSLMLTGWGPYTDMVTFAGDSKDFNIYIQGKRSSWDYANRYLTGSSMNAYFAVESFMGRESIVKMNVQEGFERVLSPSQIISATPSEIRLLSGETLSMAEDTIVVKDDRLIEPYNIMVGDTIQAVITGDQQVAVANMIPESGTGELQIFRGRIITQIEDRSSFTVQTFTMLEGSEWYYHPQPRTFAIDYSTLFYGEDGFIENGIEEFISYGENSQISAVYSLVTSGDKAITITNMPYTKESIQGEIYRTDGDDIYLKDVYYYESSINRWYQYSEINSGVYATIQPNSIIVKQGELIPASKLEIGDRLTVMMDTTLDDYRWALGDDFEGLVNVEGYIFVVN
ncbi:MAG: hypothetical protein ATN35_03130 [Epulopiscium sp. Nele67-Bin004]|nr:MAG: hypothetical protein ATN35_03130 [Epulopiscium sp. Nele67-Bin004]